MRADGTRVKNADPMYTLGPYFMVKRYDATNSVTVDIPLEPMQAYRNKMRKEGISISNLGLITAAYLRTAHDYPLLNRFVINKRIYDRNEFCVSMVVLRPGKSEGTMSKMYFDMTDDIFTVQKKIEEYISSNRDTAIDNSMDSLMQTLLKIPGLVGTAIGLIKLLDRWGLLPKKVIEASPFHSSLVISNLASIRTNHIFHHVYDFGTTSIIVTIGNLREVPTRAGSEIEFVRSMPLGIVMDERICSGSYYAQVFKRIKSYLEDPTQLEGMPKESSKA